MRKTSTPEGFSGVLFSPGKKVTVRCIPMANIDVIALREKAQNREIQIVMFIEMIQNHFTKSL